MGSGKELDMSSLKLIPLRITKDMKHVFGPQLTLSIHYAIRAMGGVTLRQKKEEN